MFVLIASLPFRGLAGLIFLIIGFGAVLLSSGIGILLSIISLTSRNDTKVAIVALVNGILIFLAWLAVASGVLGR